MGPKPEHLSDSPHEAERGATGQPRTAEEGTAVSGFPEPPEGAPKDVKERAAHPHDLPQDEDGGGAEGAAAHPQPRSGG